MGAERGMKGQMVFEFLIAAVIFIGIIIFILNILNTNVALFAGDYFVYNMENKVIAASEALVKTMGGVGLAKEWPVLDQARIDAFPNCGTLEVLEGLNLINKPGFGQPYDVRIVINESETSAPLLECGSDAPEGVTTAIIKRFGILNGEVVEITVWVW